MTDDDPVYPTSGPMPMPRPISAAHPDGIPDGVAVEPATIDNAHEALRKMEQENIKLRRKLNAVIDWTEATSEDEDDPDWPLTTHEPYAAARNRVRSIIEEER